LSYLVPQLNRMIVNDCCFRIMTNNIKKHDTLLERGVSVRTKSQ